MKFLRLFLITTLVSGLTLNIKAEDDNKEKEQNKEEVVLTSRSQAAKKALNILQNIKGIEVKTVLEKDGDNYKFNHDVNSSWNDIKDLNNKSQYLSSIVQGILLAKVGAYFISNYIEDFFNSEDSFNDDKKDAIEQKLESYIKEKLGKIDGWQKEEVDALITLKSDNFSTVGFDLKKIGLANIASNVAQTLYDAKEFIKNFTKAVENNKQDLASFFNKTKVNYDGNEYTIKEYIEEIADLLDKQIQDVLLDLANNASEAIKNWRDQKPVSQKTFEIGNGTKKKVLDIIGNSQADVADELVPCDF